LPLAASLATGLRRR